MLTLTIKFWAQKRACTIVFYTKIYKRNCMTNVLEQKVKKQVHPYKCIHPWKSLTEFSEDLLNSTIYNKDGIVVLNKPYGIRREWTEDKKYTMVANGVNYSLNDALPFIAKQLNYENLIIAKSPEMYMSGVTILAADISIQNAIQLAYIRSEFTANTYWMITVGVPNRLNGHDRLALKLLEKPGYDIKKAVFLSSWSQRDHKLKKIKIVRTQFQVLSKSTLNLCSLIEVKSSIIKRHALRLFASTFLYSPVLGDNVCATRIQKIGDTYLTIDPFLTKAEPPVLDEKLFKLLNVKPTEQQIIPVHLHLKSVQLPKFFGKTVTFEAPLAPAFNWTYNQLEFKNFMGKHVSPE